MSETLRLFYWSSSTYETVFLAFAPDEDSAYQIIAERVKQEYVELDVADVDANDVRELTIPSTTATIVIRTWE